MKKILQSVAYFVLGILVGLPFAKADELALGLVTAHTINIGNASSHFKGCLNKSCEIIQNPILAYRLVSKDGANYTSHTFLAGLNSIHEGMAGYFYSEGEIAGNHRVGFMAGGYLQDNQKFRDRHVEPFKIMDVNSIGIVPIVGLEHQYRVTKKVFTNTLFTPVVINVGLGVEF